MTDNENKEITDKLGKPFPPAAIKQRTVGGGKSLDYVQGHTVIHRLIEATDNRYDLVVRDIRWTEGMVIATVALTIPGLGSREHIGVQAVHEKGGEDLVKGAITDGIKKAATLFGVGLELYGPDYEGKADVLAEYARQIQLASSIEVLQIVGRDMASAGVGSPELRRLYHERAQAFGSNGGGKR